MPSLKCDRFSIPRAKFNLLFPSGEISTTNFTDIDVFCKVTSCFHQSSGKDNLNIFRKINPPLLIFTSTSVAGPCRGGFSTSLHWADHYLREGQQQLTICDVNQSSDSSFFWNIQECSYFINRFDTWCFYAFTSSSATTRLLIYYSHFHQHRLIHLIGNGIFTRDCPFEQFCFDFFLTSAGDLISEPLICLKTTQRLSTRRNSHKLLAIFQPMAPSLMMALRRCHCGEDPPSCLVFIISDT